jgi:hypothetical protein
MFIATIFTIAKIWNQPSCPSASEWVKKMCYKYIMEHYLAIKKEIKLCAGKWMELEIISSEISHNKKDKYHILSFICGI